MGEWGSTHILSIQGGWVGGVVHVERHTDSYYSSIELLLNHFSLVFVKESSLELMAKKAAIIEGTEISLGPSPLKRYRGPSLLKIFIMIVEQLLYSASVSDHEKCLLFLLSIQKKYYNII